MALTCPWLSLSAFITFALFLFFAAVPIFSQSKPVLFSAPKAHHDSWIKASKKNVWADLTLDEAEEVTKLVLSDPNMNLTETSRASSFDNTIRLIEVLRPNKTDALAYLSGDSGPPERWARVVVNHGASENALVVNYMAGPLPSTSSTKILPLDYCFNSDRNFVPDALPDHALLISWLAAFRVNATDVFEELLGGPIYPGNLDAAGKTNSFGVVSIFNKLEDGALTMWIQIYPQTPKNDAMSLMPQGLYIKVERRTRNPENWKAMQCYYNRRMYDSINDLRAAIRSPNFQKTPPNIEGDWTDTEDFSEGLPDRKKPPPLMIQPEGNRYQVDRKEKYVSWMGFSFYISTTSDTGASLHDVRFNGDSVIYEVGLQEALAHYAGDDPQQGSLEFLDTTFMMGKQMYELVPGYDCPAYATYLSTSYSFGGASQTNENSMCIFEYTADHALQRHTAKSYVSISRNTYLVMRSVETLGNYDYTIDYIFYLDGTIEVKVRASGFIFAAFHTAGADTEDEFGYRVHDAVTTSMHDHVINFKADLDIAGTANTLLRVGIEPITRKFLWDDEKTGPRNTMHLVESRFETETGFDWPKNAEEMYIVVNENTTNSWGEKRGYRIAAGTGMGNPSHLTILKSTSLGVSAEWAERDLWIVKQKDTEPRSSTPLNYYEPQSPLVDFSKFVNDEDIVHEDLVVYFNLGSHHVPHSGDIPNTLMHTSASSIMFIPFNFHDRDPSRRSAQGVRVQKTLNGTEPRYFGGRNMESVQVKALDLEPDLTKYHSIPQVVRNWTWVPGLLGF